MMENIPFSINSVPLTSMFIGDLTDLYRELTEDETFMARPNPVKRAMAAILVAQELQRRGVSVPAIDLSFVVG